MTVGKRLILYAVLFLAACSPLLLSPYVTGSNDVTFAGDSLDLGLIPAGQKVARQMIVTNPSEQVVHFDIQTDCGCLKITPQNFSMPPGTETSLVVELVKDRGDDREGAFTHTSGDISIRYNRGDEVLTHTAKVTASFLEPIMFDRSSLSQNRIAGQSEPVVISCSRTVPGMSAPVIEATEGWVERAEVTWNDEFNAGEIRLWPKQDLSLGLHSGGVRFQERHKLPQRLSGLTEVPFTLPIELAVRPPYSVSPPMVLLVDGEIADHDTIRLMSSTSDDFSISKILTMPDWLSGEITEDGGLAISLAAGKPPERSGEVKFEVTSTGNGDAKTMETIQVTVTQL